MLEKKNSWRVSQFLFIFEGDCYRDVDTGEIKFFQDLDDGSTYADISSARVFDTEKAAEQFRDDRLLYLSDMSKIIPGIVKEICGLDDDVCNFDRSHIIELSDSSSSSYWLNEYKKLEDVNDLLVKYIKSGMLNIDGVSIRKDDVCRLKWFNNSHVQVITSSGEKLMTRTVAEYNLVATLLGWNSSGRQFNASFDKDGHVISVKD